VAITINIATTLTTVTETDPTTGDPVERDVPEIGNLRSVLRNTTGEIYVGAIYEPPLYGSIVLEDVNSITIAGTPYRLYNGQVGSQEIFDNILAALGATRVKTGKEAETGVWRGRLESAVARLRRNDNNAASGFCANTTIAGAVYA
jgi:hypothetical protein